MITSQESLPPRIEALRLRMIGAIPCSKSEREHLLTLRFSEVIFNYIIFAVRHIPKRPRQVFYLPDFWSRRASDRLTEILKIERIIEEGGDVSPLHDAAFESGFIKKTEGKINRWNKSKDFALNAY